MSKIKLCLMFWPLLFPARGGGHGFEHVFTGKVQNTEPRLRVLGKRPSRTGPPAGESMDKRSRGAAGCSPNALCISVDPFGVVFQVLVVLFEVLYHLCVHLHTRMRSLSWKSCTERLRE